MTAHDNVSNNRKYLPYLLISLFVIITYIPSFTGRFITDDIPLVKFNTYITEWHSIGSYLSQEDGYDKDIDGHTGYYRPIINLFYTLDYKIWGMCAPGFRITNLILHLLTCFSLFVLYNLFIQKKNISLMLVLIFSLHPVNTETVSWITSRNNILVTLFGILSLFYYIRAYKNRKYHEYVLSVIFFTLSVFSKEFGLMLLPVFFLYQRILNNRKESVYIELREYLPFVLVVLVYFFFRQNVIGSLVTPAEFSDVFTRLSNTPYVFLLNLKLIFLPLHLHSFMLKYPEGVLNARTIISILCFSVIIILMCIYRKKRILIFSILTFFIAISPVLGVVQTSATSFLAMRWLYFPLPFILLFLSLPLEKVYKYNNRLTICLFTGVILYLGVNSYTLNRFLWHTPYDLYKQEVLHFNNHFYSSGLAFMYRQQNKPELAMELHKKSIEEGIRLDINYIGYAELLKDKGEYQKSLEYLEKAGAFPMGNEKMGIILHYKGVNYLNLNNLEEAESNMLKAIRLSPENPVYWEDLGVVQGKKGNHMDAINSFKKAIKLGTNSFSIYKNMANGYIRINECQKALDLIHRKIKGKNDEEVKRILKDAKSCLEEN